MTTAVSLLVRHLLYQQGKQHGTGGSDPFDVPVVQGCRSVHRTSGLNRPLSRNSRRTMVQKRVDFTRTSGAEQVEILWDGLDTNPSRRRTRRYLWQGALLPMA